MTTRRYSFRPSLFQPSRTIVLDTAGITESVDGAEDRRVPWSAIDEVHIEPATAGDDDRIRWLINLTGPAGERVRIDSVNVRGPADFEHKTAEFAAVLTAIHAALAPRGSAVRYRFGARRGILWAWRVALVLCVGAGLFGVAAAVASEQYEAILYAGAFAAFGVIGLLAIKDRRGPVAYDPAGLAEGWPEQTPG